MSPQPSSSNKPLLLFALQLTSAAWPVYAGQATAPNAVSAARGKALFTGIEPTVGRIREHQDTMPAAVVTCSNCHAHHLQPKTTGSDAPVLSASFLSEYRSRRHGPESAYDGRTFCRVLRTGFDPVYVLLDHTMPLYELSDAQCQSLWRFLQEPDKTAEIMPKSHP